MEPVKDHRPATTPEELLERLRSHGPVDLTESVAEAVAAERKGRVMILETIEEPAEELDR